MLWFSIVKGGFWEKIDLFGTLKDQKKISIIFYSRKTKKILRNFFAKYIFVQDIFWFFQVLVRFNLLPETIIKNKIFFTTLKGHYGLQTEEKAHTIVKSIHIHRSAKNVQILKSRKF